MQHSPRSLCFLALCSLALPPAASHAQSKGSAEKFPARGWKKVTITEKEKRHLNHSQVTELNPKTKIFTLQFTRPEGWTETVITNAGGTVMGRSKGESFAFPDLTIGHRYNIYILKSKRQYSLFKKNFVEYPYRDVPGKGWRQLQDGVLKLKRPKQFTPKTMFEAFDHPHHISFKPGKSKHPAVYLLTRVDGKDKDRVAAQSMTGMLEFWAHAKKGQRFQIYQIFPHDKTFRVSEPRTVKADYPLGK